MLVLTAPAALSSFLSLSRSLSLSLSSVHVRAHVAHAMLITSCWWDSAVWSSSFSFPLVWHWGDIGNALELIEKALQLLRGPVLHQDSRVGEYIGMLWGCPTLAIFAHQCNFPPDWRVKITAFMNDFELSWQATGNTMDTMQAACASSCRARGDKVKSMHLNSVEQCEWNAKCGWYLCAADPGISAEEVALALPSMDDIIDMNPGVNADVMAQKDVYNLSLNVAYVWERLGRHPEALRFADATLNNDLMHGGTIALNTRISAHMVQGRAQAALGHMQAAADAFEAAVELADKYGLWFFQALALKDLKLCVLDPLGHAEHGSRRLGESLRLLVGPAEMLAPLMDGLDVAGLMALPPPSQDHHIEFDDESVEHNDTSHSQDCLAQPEPEPHGTTQRETTLPEGTPPPRQ
jgi:hypothetical protein